jgi:hypothetical protein
MCDAKKYVIIKDYTSFFTTKGVFSETLDARHLPLMLSDLQDAQNRANLIEGIQSSFTPIRIYVKEVSVDFEAEIIMAKLKR